MRIATNIFIRGAGVFNLISKKWICTCFQVIHVSQKVATPANQQVPTVQYGTDREHGSPIFTRKRFNQLWIDAWMGNGCIFSILELALVRNRSTYFVDDKCTYACEVILGLQYESH